jgi:hypothetical protein
MVGELDFAPAFAAFDCKACILLVASGEDIIAPYKIQHRLCGGWMEWEVMGLGRLEEDLGVAISIELSSRLGHCCDKIAILLIGFGEIDLVASDHLPWSSRSSSSVIAVSVSVTLGCGGVIIL